MSTAPLAETGADTAERAASPRIVGLLSFWAHVGFIVAYLAILSTAMFYFQFAEGEFPCPLCILQRMAMMIVVIGPILVLSRALTGASSTTSLATGAGISIVGAVLGLAMSGRQVLLHIAPGDPGYGTAVMGMHLYTWALVTFLVVLVFCGVVLAGSRWLVPVAPASPALRLVARIVIWLFLATIAINAVVVFAESGWNLFLPDNPTGYRLFTG